LDVHFAALRSHRTAWALSVWRHWFHKMNYWVISPYHYDSPEIWQKIWALNERDGFISLGWRRMQNVSSLSKQEIKKRYAKKYPDSPPGRISSDSSMLFKFYNHISVGDVVVARAGRKSIAAIGTVTRPAYYDTKIAASAFPPNKAYPNHIDVDWHDEPRDLFFDRQVFGLMALHSIPIERLQTLTSSSEFKLRNFHPDDVVDDGKYVEGALKTTVVNAYERNLKARAACLKYHGYRCGVCDISFAEVYGEMGLNFIHVHHLNPLAAKKRKFKIDPKHHLIPVCPNCHAMMHTASPPVTVKKLKAIIRQT